MNINPNLIISGCTLNSMKQMEAFYVNTPSKRTKLVSKLTVDFNNRMSEMQVGALYMFKSGRMHMALTSSGHLQTLIVGWNEMDLICVGGVHFSGLDDEHCGRARCFPECYACWIWNEDYDGLRCLLPFCLFSSFFFFSLLHKDNVVL